MDKPLLVLIADDYLGVAEMLGYPIEVTCRCETITAMNGAEALALAVERRPDVVILDLDMPVMGGIDAAWAMRDRIPGPPPLMIALSGGTNVAAARKTGVFDHVFTKPADIGKVSSLLEVRWPESKL